MMVRYHAIVTRRISIGTLLGLMLLSASCVVEPRDGFYDRDQHRYYHDHAWHACVEHDDHCH